MTIRLHVLTVPGADPDRDEIVALLQQQADTQVCLHEDPQRTGVMGNWLRAVACAVHTDPPAPWSFIVQDDAYPLEGWQRHLASATHYSPEPVLGLTHFGSYGEKALEKGAPYAVGGNLLWGGAIAYRRDFLEGLAQWAPKVVAKTRYPHDDRLIGAYAYKIGRATAMTSRAIFDQPVQASLLNHNTKIRRPVATICTRLGPPYGASPRATRMSSVMPEQKRLAAEEI